MDSGNICRKISLILVSLCFIISAGHPQTTVAVYDFFNLTGLDGIGIAVAEGLALNLAGSDNLVLLERTQLEALNREIDFGQLGISDRQTVADAGKRLGAQYVILGAVDEEVDLWGVQIYLFDVENERFFETQEVIGWNLYELVNKLLPELAGGTEGKIKIVAGELPTRSRQAFTAYARALYLTELQRVEDALNSVEEALLADPDFHLAQKLQKKLQQQLLRYLQDQHAAMDVWYLVPVVGWMTKFFVEQGGGNNPLALHVSSQSLLMSGFTGYFSAATIQDKSNLVWVFAPFNAFFIYNTLRSKNVEKKIDRLQTRLNPSYTIKKFGVGFYYVSQPAGSELQSFYQDVYRNWQVESAGEIKRIWGVGLEIYSHAHRFGFELLGPTLSANPGNRIYNLDHHLLHFGYSYLFRVSRKDIFRPYLGIGGIVSVADLSASTVVGYDTTSTKSSVYDYGGWLSGGVNFIWADDLVFETGVYYNFLDLSRLSNTLNLRRSYGKAGTLVFRFKIGLFFG